MNKGALCISLDFEKFWGTHDVACIKDSEERLLKVSEVVTRLLGLFEKYDIHCTWAVVGMLNFSSNAELIDYCKNIKGAYDEKNFSPFPLDKFRLENFDKSAYLGGSDIVKIKEFKNQEIASHTFSHYYCLESGQNSDDFQYDMSLFNKLFKEEVKSIVFPRNQVSDEYLKLCSKSGITSYRGNQENRYWKNSSYKNEGVLKKIGRTVDAYIKISKDNLVDWNELNSDENGITNISASRFLRPYQFFTLIENLKVRRIKKQMLKAAKTNKIYHLWWHPHNFTSKMDENFSQLEKLLSYYRDLKQQYDFDSLNMNEISRKVG